MSLAVLVYPRSLSHHCSDAFLVFPACRGGKPTCVMFPQGEKSAWHRLALHILLLGGREDSRISCQQRACGHSHCLSTASNVLELMVRLGQEWVPSDPTPNHHLPTGAWPAPRHGRRGQNITSFSTPKLQKDANFSIPHPQALLCFPGGAWGSQLGKLRQRGGRRERERGAGSAEPQHPAARWGGGRRDL